MQKPILVTPKDSLGIRDLTEHEQALTDKFIKEVGIHTIKSSIPLEVTAQTKEPTNWTRNDTVSNV